MIEDRRNACPVVLFALALSMLLASGMTQARERVPREPEAAALPQPEIPWGEKAIAVDDRKEVPLVTRVVMADHPADQIPTLVLGEPMPIRYEKKNNGKKELDVWHCGFWPNHRITVLRYDRSEAPLTPRGREGRDALSSGGPREKNVQWPIEAGKTDATEGNYDLRELFEISAPGRYKVRVGYEDNLKSVSNTLTFWVLPAKAADALDKINGWDREECDVAERPDEYPGRASAGETNGFLSTWKGVILAHGFIPLWKPTEKRYRIERSIYTPNPDLIKPGEQACKQNGDCLAVPASCCGCTAGGKASVINKTHKDSYNKRSNRHCQVACPAVMSSHPFCGRKPACRSGTCAWAPTD